MSVLIEVDDERRRQHEIWGEQNHSDGTGDPRFAHMAEMAKLACDMETQNGSVTWHHILTEEVLEAFAERDSEKLRAELVQVAAVAVSWIEAIDRRSRQ